MDGKREKSFRRTADPKIHIQECHKDHQRLKSEPLPKVFHLEKNGFWLALYPKDYIRLMRPNPRLCEAAVRARMEIISWVRVNSLVKRKLQEVEQG